MLVIFKEIFNSSGYFCLFSGIVKCFDVNGVLCGVEYNMVQNVVYCVCGGKFYKGESEVGDVVGSGCVLMVYGWILQVVGVNG